MIASIEKLWKLSGNERSEFQENENPFFDDVGLILLTEIKHLGYWCTPTNTVTFAITGGDGVHYGLLCDSNTIDDNQPVVMTLPCADNCNIIIAENFIEFLSLGSRSGYFDLEQIEYCSEEHIAKLDSTTYSEEASESEVLLLKKIESEFSLQPWLDHEARLSELKKKYFNLLKYSEEYYEIIG